MKLTIQSSDQAIAVIPHLLGFEPEESVVVVPVSGHRAPTARVDLPQSAAEQREAIGALADSYGSGRWGETAVLIVCFSADPGETRAFSAQLEEAMQSHDVRVVGRLAAGVESWVDFTRGTWGPRTSEAKNLIAAEAAFAGRPVPLASRSELAAEFTGNTDLIADELCEARTGRDQSTRELERRFCRAVVEQYQCDHQRLDLGDAARLLVNLEIDPGLFIQMAGEIRTHTAVDWLPMWKDLAKHAPEEVRAEPACLAALAAWCAGDGASAWSALERIPTDMPADHPIAPVSELLRQSLSSAAHPQTWDKICDQAFAGADSGGQAVANRRRSASGRGQGEATPGMAI